MRACVHLRMIIFRWILLRIRNVSDKSLRENQNTHFWFSNFFRKWCRLWGDLDECCRAGEVVDDNMAYVHCMLDTQGYKYILRICNTYRSSTARVVAQTLYVHCLSCLLSQCSTEFRGTCVKCNFTKLRSSACTFLFLQFSSLLGLKCGKYG